ncbi:hypothetical protein B0T21DRAFT_351945 [Apiosordaria backusii]|uniref:Uncharacterized protein n=1 Tax=Apiosordaria backusii TaxID=314023 RepID=A0AA40AIK5_9PEZI|nr:hypothetical protein B0T21DRAFT_351945 [Apiosordaria backusii]
MPVDGAYTHLAVFKFFYDELKKHRQPDSSLETARNLWTQILQKGYFHPSEDWVSYVPRRSTTPHNDPPVLVMRVLNKVRDEFELGGVMVADDCEAGGWGKQEEQVVGFVKGIAGQEGHTPREGGVFAIVPKGTKVRFYWLDGEGVLMPYPLSGEQVYEVKEDEEEILEVLKDITERFA